MVKACADGKRQGRLFYSDEFRQEAVRMILDGHSAVGFIVANRLQRHRRPLEANEPTHKGVGRARAAA